jgi:uncharacterized lipoprotein YddW (UPF0748 family)
VRQNLKSGLFSAVFILSMLAVMILSLPLKAQTAITQQQTSELSGVWLTNIDSDVFFDRDSLQKALRNLDTFNFNTLYPAV